MNNWKDLDISNKIELKKHLFRFVSNDRQALFQKVLENRTKHFAVAVEDPYLERNAGAIIRTCDCLGIQEMHIIENSNEYKVSHHISSGANKWLDLHIYDQGEKNSQKCFEHLRSKGYRLIATTPHADDKTLAEFDISRPAAFIFGGEKDGLTPAAMELADEYLKIPLYGFTESYNISVAAALVIYDVINRLRASKIDWQLTEEEQLDVLIQWSRLSVRSGEQLISRFLSQVNNR